MTNDDSECEYCFPIEVGHIITEPQGVLCKCGNHGCFEAMYNIIRIIESVNDKAGLELPSEDEFDSETNKESMRVIARFLDEGNKLVTDTIQGLADEIIRWLVGIVSADQPDQIYLCGSATLLGKKFLDMINSKLQQYTLLNDENNMTVHYSCVGNEEKRKGAVYMLLDEIYAL